MHRTALGLAAALMATSLLAACQTPTSKADQAIIGAGVGALAADLTDHDPLKGAVAGAAAGYICDDVGICRPRR